MSDVVICALAVLLGWCFGEAQYGTGPFVSIGRWRNERVAAKTLRLLHATAPGPSKFFPFTEWGPLSIHGPAPRPPRES